MLRKVTQLIDTLKQSKFMNEASLGIKLMFLLFILTGLGGLVCFFVINLKMYLG